MSSGLTLIRVRFGLSPRNRGSGRSSREVDKTRSFAEGATTRYTDTFELDNWYDQKNAKGSF